MKNRGLFFELPRPNDRRNWNNRLKNGLQRAETRRHCGISLRETAPDLRRSPGTQPFASLGLAFVHGVNGHLANGTQVSRIMKPDKNNPQKEEEMIEGPGDPDSSGGPTPAPIKLPGTTQRLSLRRFNKTDAPILGQLFNDREIASNTRTFDFPYNQQMAEEWIGKHQLGWEVGEGFVFAIERSSDGELLGAIGLHVNKEDHQAELGYTIGREFWGQGFCTEAARSVVEFGFDEVGLHKITSHHMIRNPASGRVLQKIGMTHEGTFRGHVRKWGVFEDIEVYGMLADDKRA